MHGALWTMAMIGLWFLGEGWRSSGRIECEVSCFDIPHPGDGGVRWDPETETV